MSKASISPSEVEEFRNGLNILTDLLHRVLRSPNLSKDPKFLHQVQEVICSLNELSKL